MPIKGCLYNVRGVHPTSSYKAKLPGILYWKKLIGCNFMALTETHTSAEANPFSSFSFNHLSSSAYSSTRTKVAGVAIIAMDLSQLLTLN